METPAKTTKHFPRKGERFVDGVWVTPDSTPTSDEPQERPDNGAKARRDFARRMAGWPVKD